ncbi:MAG: MotA/TolQ/ExbB proton channel family protein [Thermoguttaceae bacterium]|jgi:biopolymer transport protein ExbB
MNRYLRFVFLFFFLAFPLVLAAQDIDFDSDIDDDSFLDGPVAAAPADPGAQGAAPASPGSETPKKESYLVWMFRALGWFFGPVFVLLSLLDVALIVMNMLAVRRVHLVPESLILEFGELMDDQKFQEAYQVAKENDSLLGRVLAAGLSRVPSGYDKAVQTMQDVGQEETMKLEHQIGYLALIGNIAPMIGLFGTVVGMIASFQVIAAGGATPSPQKLAEGIATALFTTMIGLSIAIPSLAIYDIIKNRLARFILEIGIISDNYIGRFSSVSPQK